MKKLLLLLLATPFIQAEEYYFSCLTKETGNTASVIVNTTNGSVQLGELLFDWAYRETESTIEVARMFNNDVTQIQFNKITGVMLQSGVGWSYNYECKVVQRLIP